MTNSFAAKQLYTAYYNKRTNSFQAFLWALLSYTRPEIPECINHCWVFFCFCSLNIWFSFETFGYILHLSEVNYDHVTCFKQWHTGEQDLFPAYGQMLTEVIHALSSAIDLQYSSSGYYPCLSLREWMGDIAQDSHSRHVAREINLLQVTASWGLFCTIICII